MSGQLLRIAVLMGGTSSEREVSLATGSQIAENLDNSLYEVACIDTADLPLLAAASADARRAIQPRRADGVATAGITFTPDVVFIALHGKGGEDGLIQGLLESLGIRHTGSGVMASAIAMDKAMCKRVVSTAGVPVAPHIEVRRSSAVQPGQLAADLAAAGLAYPLFVKPNRGGSTIGGSRVDDADSIGDAVRTALVYDDIAMIEPWLTGAEITVGVLGNAGCALEALPTIEIVPRSAWYDYDSKYADGGSEHLIPARIPPTLDREAREAAITVHELLGCRGMSRSDFLVHEGKLSFLEVNTVPGMTPTSLLPQAAEAAGIPFAELLNRLIALSVESSSNDA